MVVRVASELMYDSIVDGPGLRIVLWTQGCPHHCKGCHNPQTWDYNAGYDMTIEDIMNDILKVRLQQGLTISGGEPFEQVDKLVCLVEEIKKRTSLDIWVYTGYLIEELTDIKNKNYYNNIKFLKNIDVLVDGKFDENKKNIDLKFKGSENQRVIDVQETIKTKKLQLYKK